jgi:hypothetical protein
MKRARIVPLAAGASERLPLIRLRIRPIVPETNEEGLSVAFPSSQITRSQALLHQTSQAAAPTDFDTTPTCPVCSKIIIGDAEDVNEHIDACINGNDPTGSHDGEEEAVPEAMLHRTSSLINIDEDEGSALGRQRYCEADVEQVQARALQSKRKLDEEQRMHLSHQRLLQTIISSPDPSLLAVKGLLQHLLDQIAAAPKCSLCMDALQMPATVSTNCWHIFCEDCWLRQLGTKRICPQCSCITDLSDLQRVFF